MCTIKIAPSLKQQSVQKWKFLLLILFFLPALAKGITISVNPSAQTVPLGAPVSINVAIEGLGTGSAPSLGTFDFNVSFDPTVLAFSSITFGDPILGDQLGPILGSITGSSVDPLSGLINQFEISLELTSDLNALQADSFVLTSIIFSTVALGTSPLDISDAILGDADGNPLSALIENGMVQVSVTGVPDGGATALLLTGSLFFMACIRRKCL